MYRVFFFLSTLYKNWKFVRWFTPGFFYATQNERDASLCVTTFLSEFFRTGRQSVRQFTSAFYRLSLNKSRLYPLIFFNESKVFVGAPSRRRPIIGMVEYRCPINWNYCRNYFTEIYKKRRLFISKIKFLMQLLDTRALLFKRLSCY